MASDRATLKVEQRSEFGSRTSRRLRRAGLVPGVVYGGGEEARPFQVPEREVRTVLTDGGALIDVEFDGSAPTPVVVKEQQRHPVRGSLIHLDLLEVKLDEEIQAEVAIELLGAEDAPGVKEGGVLEHVTHEITVEALPTEIPESIAADVSGMEIGDTLQLSAVDRARGRRVRARRGEDPDEVTIATLSPPRVEEEPEPEVEEEAELVGEEGEVPEGEEAAEEGEGRRGRGFGRGRRLRTGSSPLSLLRRLRSGASRTSPRPRWRAGPRADRRPRQPGLALRGHPPQPRLRGRRRALAPLGAAAGQGALPRADHRGPRRARAARGSPCSLPQTYMNESGELGGPGARRAEGAARAASSSSTTRSTCRSARSAPSSAAASPATTA